VLQDGEDGFPVIQPERDKLVSPGGRVEKDPRAAVEACPRKQRGEHECLLSRNAYTGEDRHAQNRTPRLGQSLSRVEFAKATHEESSEARPGLWRRASSLTGLGSPRARAPPRVANPAGGDPEVTLSVFTFSANENPA
jgi:hypothetical protein